MKGIRVSIGGHMRVFVKVVLYACSTIAFILLMVILYKILHPPKDPNCDFKLTPLMPYDFNTNSYMDHLVRTNVITIQARPKNKYARYEWKSTTGFISALQNDVQPTNPWDGQFFAMDSGPVTITCTIYLGTCATTQTLTLDVKEKQ